MNGMNLNYKKYLIISICVLVFGVALGAYGIPKLLKKMIKGVSVLEENITPFFIYFNVFFQ